MAILTRQESDNGRVQINYYRQIAGQGRALEKLNTNLRVQRSSDDQVSLSLAHRLAGQARQLGQAAKNAADGVSILAVADDSLDQATTLLTEIQTRAEQGTATTLSTADRIRLQSDLGKLLHELEQTITGSSYEQQPLLTGAFLNKNFQIGPNPNDRVQLTIASADLQVLGKSDTTELSLADPSGATVALYLRHRQAEEALAVAPVELKFNNSAANGMGGLAAAINTLGDRSGIAARAVVVATSSGAIQAGATGADFAINGVTLGTITVQAEDANGQLTAAINRTTSDHGVDASLALGGRLQLQAGDGRPIAVAGLGTVLAAADAAALSTFGHLFLIQSGSFTIEASSSGITLGGEATMRLRDLNVSSAEEARNAVVLAAAALTDLRQQREETARDRGLFTGIIRSLAVGQFHSEQATARLQEFDPQTETSNFSRALLFAKSGPFALAATNLMQKSSERTIAANGALDLGQQVYLLGRMQSLLRPKLFAASQANANGEVVTALLQGGGSTATTPKLRGA